jgi:hypothetical protein
MRDTVPRFEEFLTALPKHADELNSVKLRLAHKDLHFTNMLHDANSGKITEIIDWEFSGIVHFTKWNPHRLFLWNRRDGEESKIEKQRLMGLFVQRCKEKGVTILDDASYCSPLQESMQTVADFWEPSSRLYQGIRGKNLCQNGEIRCWKILLVSIHSFAIESFSKDFPSHWNRMRLPQTK